MSNLAIKDSVSILGFAKSAVAAIEYLQKKYPKIKIRVSELKNQDNFDQKLIKELESKSVEFEFGKNTFDFIKDADFIMLSPGIPPKAPIIQEIFRKDLNYGTDIDIFCADTDDDFIVVTGTNGKTTTASLIAHIFGTEVLANIGDPVLNFHKLKRAEFTKAEENFEEDDKKITAKLAKEKIKAPYVLELSSFQLFYSRYLRAPKVGVYTNLTPDHLDWHSDLDEYKTSKEKIFLLQDKSQYGIFNYDDPAVTNFVQRLEAPARLEKGSAPWLRFFSVKSILDWMQDSAYLDFGELILSKANDDINLADLGDLNLVGEHNYANILAAVLAADSLGMETQTIKEKLLTFKPVEHRMEYVASIDGKPIYNDSKATNPESAIKSMQAFDLSIAIVGGKDKKLKIGDFLDTLSFRAAKVIAIGELKDQIKAGLAERDFDNVELADDLESALKAALTFKETLPIVFAPASSSFDMFKDYEERGKQFKAVVEKLGGLVHQ